MWHLQAKVRLAIAAGILIFFPMAANAVLCVTEDNKPAPPDGDMVQMLSVNGKLVQLVSDGFYSYTYLKDTDSGIYSVHTLGNVTVALHKTKPYLLMIYKGNETQYVYKCTSMVKIIPK